jgi:hypothetical protein
MLPLRYMPQLSMALTVVSVVAFTRHQYVKVPNTVDTSAFVRTVVPGGLYLTIDGRNPLPGVAN